MFVRCEFVSLLNMCKCCIHGVCWWYIWGYPHRLHWSSNYPISNSQAATGMKGACTDHVTTTKRHPPCPGGLKKKRKIHLTRLYLSWNYPPTSHLLILACCLNVLYDSSPVKKKVLEHFHSAGSLSGLQSWYFARVPHTDLSILSYMQYIKLLFLEVSASFDMISMVEVTTSFVHAVLVCIFLL